MTLKAPLLVLAFSATFALAACSGDAATPGAGGPSGAAASSASGDGGTPTGGDRDGCLTGTWAVDVDDLAQQASKIGAAAGRSGSGAGAITVTFGDQMKIAYDNAAITIKSAVSGSEIVMKSTFSGSATSTDWKATGGKIGGTMPGGTVKTKTVMVMGGVETPVPTGGFDGNLDISKNTLSYTCSGDKLTFNNGFITWKLTKK